MTRHPKPDVAQVITDLILEKIAAGTAPWLKPWTSTCTRRISSESAFVRSSANRITAIPVIPYTNMNELPKLTKRGGCTAWRSLVGAWPKGWVKLVWSGCGMRGGFMGHLCL